MRITIRCAGIQMDAVLGDTDTARAIWNALPLTGRISTWGDEIYFEIPVAVEEENPVTAVDEGDLAYWPNGRCFCIFFGKTPLSTETEIKPAAPVNIIGRLTGDPNALRALAGGAEITIERA